jgi:hypothetical protein
MELGDRVDSFTYAFNAQPGTVLPLDGPKTGQGYGALDVGFDASIATRATVSLDYAPRFDGRGIMDHQFSVSARYAF